MTTPIAFSPGCQACVQRAVPRSAATCGVASMVNPRLRARSASSAEAQ